MYIGVSKSVNICSLKPFEFIQSFPIEIQINRALQQGIGFWHMYRRIPDAYLSTVNIDTVLSRDTLGEQRNYS